MKKFKIKDLPKDFNLVGCKLGNKYIYSGWNKGFWLKDNEQSSNLTPKVFKDFDEIKDWEVEVSDLRAIEIIKLVE